ncbi:MAG: ABC transporter permease, partial [Ignavibacterium sp.]
MTSMFLELREGLTIAWWAIRANKIRAILTMLGIFIGVTAVVLMSTAIKGIDNSLQQGVSSLGSDVLYIDKWAWFSNEEWWRMRNRRNIEMNDYYRFKDLVKLPLAIAPVSNTVQTIKYGDRKVEMVFLNGSTSDYVKTTNFDFSAGRFYSDIESDGARNVAVIGSEISSKLFPRGDAIDKTIKIGPVNYKVVGVLAEQGSTLLGAFNPDNQVFVPLGTIFKYFASRNMRSITINVRAANPEMLEATKDEAEGIMRKIRGLAHNEPNDFSINQQEGLTSFLDSITIIIKIAGLFITGLSLFVGAVGIMNIMFV